LKDVPFTAINQYGSNLIRGEDGGCKVAMLVRKVTRSVRKVTRRTHKVTRRPDKVTRAWTR
jgi:hypothetical protein